LPEGKIKRTADWKLRALPLGMPDIFREIRLLMDLEPMSAVVAERSDGGKRAAALSHYGAESPTASRDDRAPSLAIDVACTIAASTAFQSAYSPADFSTSALR
jgi:hypothetical protein